MQVAELFDKASGKLPMVPKVVQELIASFNNQNVNMDDVADKVAHDQVLSARVLRLANTARFGGSRKIGSLDDAVVMLGFDNLRVLVIASGVSGATSNIPGFDMKSFWGRSFEMANTSKALAKLAGLEPQLGYTCGLISNIGELVLHVAEPDKAVQIDRVVDGGADRLVTERMVLGMDLTEVGAELARRWSFPDAIQEAIRNQHNLVPPADASPYALLIGLASYIVAGFNRGMSEQDMLETVPPRVVAALNISAEQLESAIGHLKEMSTQIDSLL
jgi:HD-like signal output (HDOD) protein